MTDGFTSEVTLRSELHPYPKKPMMHYAKLGYLRLIAKDVFDELRWPLNLRARGSLLIAPKSWSQVAAICVKKRLILYLVGITHRLIRVDTESIVS